MITHLYYIPRAPDPLVLSPLLEVILGGYYYIYSADMQSGISRTTTPDDKSI